MKDSFSLGFKILLFFYKKLPDPARFIIKKIYAYLYEKFFSNINFKIKGKFVIYKNNKFKNIACGEKLKKGVNVIGFIKCDMGLGHQVRSIINSLQHFKIPMSLKDFSNAVPYHTDDDSLIYSSCITQDRYRCNFVSVNTDWFYLINLDKIINYFTYNIYYVAWELNIYPKSWLSTTNMAHEIWTMSRFVYDIIFNNTPLPVFFMPYAVDFEIKEHLKREYFNLPEDKFLFLFSFDFSSEVQRKNPIAVLKAFLSAFPSDKNVGLVFKITREPKYSYHKKIFDEFIKYCTDERIHVLDKIYSNYEIKNLINLCDCYISLHRSEGFGLCMAEAMKLGKPVIATNYSGNTDFTTSETACVVDYKLIPVNSKDYLYHEPGQAWADPNIEHAAYYMQKLYNDSDFYKEKALAGKNFIDANYNYSIIGERFVKRLKLLDLV